MYAGGVLSWNTPAKFRPEMRYYIRVAALHLASPAHPWLRLYPHAINPTFNWKEDAVVKISANMSKKVPIPGTEFSS